MLTDEELSEIEHDAKFRVGCAHLAELTRVYRAVQSGEYVELRRLPRVAFLAGRDSMRAGELPEDDEGAWKAWITDLREVIEAVSGLATAPRTGEAVSRALPQWQPTPPPSPGVYFTFSDLEQRTDGVGVGRWDGEVWQMHLGWYDNAITHWMAADLNDEPGEDPPAMADIDQSAVEREPLTKRLRNVVPYQGKSSVAFLCREAADEIDRLSARADEAEREAHELTKALTGLTCGGSEFFLRKGDRYIADIPACVGYVRRRDEDAHNRTVHAILERKAAEAELTRLRAIEAAGRELKELLREGAEEAWADAALGCAPHLLAGPRAAKFRDKFYDWRRRAREALAVKPAGGAEQ